MNNIVFYPENHGVGSINGTLLSLISTGGFIFCFECQCFQSSKKFYPTPCSNCGGYKCKKHGGVKYHCPNCDKTSLCIDCIAFRECCD